MGPGTEREEAAAQATAPSRRGFAIDRSAHNREPESLATRAYRELLERLILLDIPPGAPIREADLAAEFGVGRTPLREALKRLEVDQLVVSYPRRGTFATHVDITGLAAIVEVRRVLEPLGARLAAARLTPAGREQCLRVRESLANLSDDMPPRALLELDVDVHRSVYAASGNPHLEQELVRLHNLATRMWCMVLDRLPPISEHVREHDDLLHAIIEGDGDAAAAFVSNHVDGFEKALRTAM